MKGKKTGGRKKGSRNKGLTETKVALAVAETGETPLDYLLRIMRDPDAGKEWRFEAAVKAAKYVHATQAAVSHSGPGGGPIETKIIVVPAKDKL